MLKRGAAAVKAKLTACSRTWLASRLLWAPVAFHRWRCQARQNNSLLGDGVLDKETIARLNAAPIEFIGYVMGPGGRAKVSLSAEDLDGFCADPEGVYAQKHGATREDFVHWVATDGRPRCGGKTTKQKRCGNFVSGGMQMSLDVWLSADGGLCVVHGGEGSPTTSGRR